MQSKWTRLKYWLQDRWDESKLMTILGLLGTIIMPVILLTVIIYQFLVNPAGMLFVIGAVLCTLGILWFVSKSFWD